MDGNCRRTTNGGSWRTTTVGSARILMTGVKRAYKALLVGGNSGFNALLAADRSDDGQYARLEAHGFYRTASESNPASGWFYNFGRGGQASHRQSGGEKQRAFSVRCVRE